MSIGKHTSYNFIGALIPMALALFTVPAYLHLIGPERYGILSLAWLILGYFGVFDLGLGRAVTQRIASLRDESRQSRATAFGTALVSNIVIGAIGMAVMWPVAYYVFANSVDMSPSLRREAISCAPLLALALPIATTIGMLSGALMGREKFLEINRTSVTSTILFQLAPLATAWILGPGLWTLLAVSIAARLMGLVLYWRHCLHEFGSDAWRHFDRAQLGKLLKFGGWVTVTGLFAPLLSMSDRFMIGSVIGATAVAVYTIPVQLVTRLSTITTSLCTALFPRFAAGSEQQGRQFIADAQSILLVLMTIPVCGLMWIIQPFLVLWVGPEIGEASGTVARLWLIAVWINAFAQIPYTQLQAQGKPDGVAKSMAIQAPPYLIAMIVLLRTSGVNGAAVCNLLRTVIDYVVLNVFAHKGLPGIGKIAAFSLLVIANFAGAELFHIGLLQAIMLAAGASCVTAAIAGLVHRRGIAVLLTRYRHRPTKLAEGGY